MTSYISAALRREVVTRADGVCEYCLIHEEDTYWGCQVDHVVSEKHGGVTNCGNLAYACTCCNRAKGSDVGSITSDGDFTRFFNPRTDHWQDHFQFRGARIEGRTAIGEVTAKVLGFNTAARIMERQSLQELGRYPPPQAVQRARHGGAESADRPDQPA